MIEQIFLRKGEARIYFSTIEERNLFLQGIKGMDGVLELKCKENTRTLLVKFKEGSFMHYLLENLGSKKRSKLEREDLHSYIQPLLKHPAAKLGFSIIILGWKVGLISFAVCGMLLTPYLKTKL